MKVPTIAEFPKTEGGGVPFLGSSEKECSVLMYVLSFVFLTSFLGGGGNKLGYPISDITRGAQASLGQLNLDSCFFFFSVGP